MDKSDTKFSASEGAHVSNLEAEYCQAENLADCIYKEKKTVNARCTLSLCSVTSFVTALLHL